MAMSSEGGVKVVELVVEEVMLDPAPYVHADVYVELEKAVNDLREKVTNLEPSDETDEQKTNFDFILDVMQTLLDYVSA